MRSTQRYLIVGLATAMAPITIVVAAPEARADCTYSGGSTVCAQGEVRGADGVPRAATAVVPYPCEYDYLCGDDWDVGWGGPGIGYPGIGLPGRPGGIGPRR